MKPTVGQAIAGGTPACRREFARDVRPAGPGDFDGWVMRTVLNPADPLFREARYPLADEPDLRDIDAAGARLLCFSGAGFSDELVREAGQHADVVLIGPAELYAGSAALRRHQAVRASV